MAKGGRSWAQLDAFEAEYAERLAAEKARGRDSQFLEFLRGLARGYETFWADEVNPRDGESGRLFALRGKILGLRDKLGVEGSDPTALLPVERDVLGGSEAETKRAKTPSVEFARDPLPPNHVYPIGFKEIKATLAELPSAHAATVWRVHLTNQKRTGTDGDWLDGEIRLHCLLEADPDSAAERGRRLVGRSESTLDIERFGGSLEWEGNRLYALWPLASYKTFVLRRVLIHEVAHGVAELPGVREAVRSAGSVEKFCEQYAENFYRPPGKSVKLPF
jgi:hypothetical protein